MIFIFILGGGILGIPRVLNRNAPDLICRARRRRRYGRGPNKYDRTWEDEDAYSKPRGGGVAGSGGGGGGRGRGGAGRGFTAGGDAAGAGPRGGGGGGSRGRARLPPGGVGGAGGGGGRHYGADEFPALQRAAANESAPAEPNANWREGWRVFFIFITRYVLIPFLFSSTSLRSFLIG